MRRQDTESGIPLPNSPLKRNVRRIKNQPLSILTAKEASKFGLDTFIHYYDFYESKHARARTGGPRREHHISEITVLQPGETSTRYVFGLPTYNLKQEEVSFSVNKSKANCSSGLVEYEPGIDNTTSNRLGREEYFNKTEIPPYADSYLLTAILSDDYVDRTGNGPSPDDFGDYVKFTFYKLDEPYKWRIPYPKDSANYNPGFLTDPLDDKGNYTYGEKEIFYIRSVENKTQVARFYYAFKGRHDELSVLDENGGKDIDKGKRLKSLEQIKFYSLLDYNSGSTSNPLKTIDFVYDYSLCNNVPSAASAGGKLTLKELHISNGKSWKGKSTPYKFNYETGSRNPDYKNKAYSNWGSYKPNQAGNCDPNSLPGNSDFPYLSKIDSTLAAEYASAWHLKSILTPGGGLIEVTYEANDYAFVQNKYAMQLFDIVDVNTASAIYAEPGTSKNLYGATPKNRIFFRLKQHLDLAEAPAKEYLRNHYLRELANAGDVFFKAFVDLDGNNHYEYVPGYLKIKGYGVAGPQISTGYQYGYIDVDPACMKDKETPSTSGSCTQVNPIAKAAWQFARLNRPEIAYGTSITPDPNLKNFLRSLAALKTQFVQFINGFNQEMQAKGFGKKINTNKSWIRLYTPDQVKIGGGTRVKRVIIHDNWDKMAGAVFADKVYGQEYEYRTTTMLNNQPMSISSGVAAYEPILGGEENPFRQPVFAQEYVKLAPDNRHYIEEPLGEAFFPAASIVYSKTTVRNIAYEGVTRTRTGELVYEFYTAKDYPTITKNTGLALRVNKTDPILNFLKIESKHYVTASEGFVVINNDMHGKPKAEWVFNESGGLVSGMEYRYRGGYGKSPATVKAITPEGELIDALKGIDYQVVADAREAKTKVMSGGAQLNLDIFFLFPPPAVIYTPSGYPSFASEQTRFRSIVFCKNIMQYGILESTIVHDQGSSVETKNLAYDSETGEVLLTETSNSFGDPMYNLKIPAHWAYEGMEPAYQNLKARHKLQSLISGNVPIAGTASTTVSGPEFLLTQGDEVGLYKGNGEPVKKAWVKDVEPSTGKAYIIDGDGQPISPDAAIHYLRVLRSGHRNQQMAPMATITSLNNPIDGTNHLNLTGLKVLNTSALEYCDEWQTYCDNCNNFVLSPASKALLDLLNLLIENNKFQNIFQEGDHNYMPILNTNPIMTNIFSETSCNISTCTNLSVETIKRSYGFQLTITCGSVGVIDCPDLDDPSIKCDLFFTSPSFNSVHSINNMQSISIDYQAASSSGQSEYINLPLIAEWEGGYKLPLTLETNCLLDCLRMTCSKQDTGNSPCDQIGDVVNPYLKSIRGRWRPKRNWVYLSNRIQGTGVPANSGSTNIRKDGPFEHFSSFWEHTTVGWEKQTTDPNWIWASETTKIDPHGNQLENRDALGRFSSNLMGYNNIQVIASAVNARYCQIDFTDHDDINFTEHDDFVSSLAYNPSPKEDCSMTQHSKFGAPVAHSGRYSKVLAPLGQVSYTYPIAKDCNPDEQCNPVYACGNSNRAFTPYQLRNCDCLGRFSPQAGKYVFSVWVKEQLPPDSMSYKDPRVEIIINGVTTTIHSSGPIIEGWQRMYGEFEVPQGADEIKVSLISGKKVTFFDSYRIHPFESSMQTYVYDMRRLLPVDFHDENNYFTRYEYNEALEAVRVKKETERGIMTIKEQRTGLRKQ